MNNGKIVKDFECSLLTLQSSPEHIFQRKPQQINLSFSFTSLVKCYFPVCNVKDRLREETITIKQITFPISVAFDGATEL